MNRWIFLLRGVTPVGKGKVPMARLREEMTVAGFQNTRTWIQSGNAIADTELDRMDARKLAEAVLKDKIGAELAVITVSAEEIKQVLQENPFKELPLERIFFGLFNQKLEKEKADALVNMDFGEDLIRIYDWMLYCFIPGSAARSKMNNAYLQRKLGVTLTMRNANTFGYSGAVKPPVRSRLSRVSGVC